MPKRPHTVVFGETRKVSWQSTVSVGSAVYSVPHELIDQRVWVRVVGDELIVVATDGPAGAREVARHALTTPGPAEHPGRPLPAQAGRARWSAGPAPSSQDEKQFLQIGPGAERWLRRAAADGTPRLRRKLAEAVDLSKLHGAEPVNRALESCANAGRFADGDLARILAHQQQRDAGGELVAVPSPRRGQLAASIDQGMGRVRGMTVTTPPRRRSPTSSSDSAAGCDCPISARQPPR